MKKAAFISGLLLFWTALIQSAVASAHSDWEEQMQTGTRAYFDGRLEAAEKNLSGALITAKKSQDAPEPIIKSLKALVVLYLLEERYAEAERLCKEELQFLAEHKLKLDNEEACALANLGQSYLGQDKLDEAEASLKRAWTIETTDRTTTMDTMSRTAHNLVKLYYRQHKEKDAEDILNLLHVTRKQLSNKSDPGIAEDLTLLALHYWSEGKLTAAEQSFKKAIAIYNELPNANVELGSTLHTYAMFLRASNRIQEADMIEEQSKKVRGN